MSHEDMDATLVKMEQMGTKQMMLSENTEMKY